MVFSGSATATSYISLQYNGDTASNYSVTLLRGNGSAASSSRYSNITEIYASISATNTTDINNVIFQIQNYSNTTTFKTSLSRSNNAGVSVEAGVGLWRNTAAINSVKILSPTNNFAVGSTFSLYGIKSEEAASKATGGYVTSDANYYYHTFTSSGTFTPLQTLNADVLVVAGGGGGGTNGGGGGAGGLSYQANRSCTINTNYTVTIGAGGSKGLSNALATNGGNSVFDTITSNGGGSGGSTGVTPQQQRGSIGGSGGGNSYDDSTTAATSNQGNTGGATGFGTSGGVGRLFGSGDTRGGGGGGAGVAGASGTASGAGGDGVSTYSSWGAATGTGQNISGTYWYAGGAGGWTQSAGRGTAAGGNGGGGAGAPSGSNAVAGTANTGGGGGGGDWNSPNIRTANGGSGIVIVRYSK